MPRYSIGTQIPVGCIFLWSGSTASIPDGFVICDGNNGTPDLRDRFIVGAGSTYAVADTGGLVSVTLSIAQMPLHYHSLNKTMTSSTKFFPAAGTTSTPWLNTGPTPNTSAVGGDESHENLPPYYSLAYIMKI